RRAADYTQRGAHHQEDCGSEGAFAGCASAYTAACVWHAYAGGGRRSPRDPGVAGTRAAGYHAALHAAIDEAGVAGLRSNASAGEVGAARSCAGSDGRRDLLDLRSEGGDAGATVFFLTLPTSLLLLLSGRRLVFRRRLPKLRFPAAGRLVCRTPFLAG